MAGFTNEAVRSGFGRHIYYLTPEQITHAIQMSYIIGPFGCMTLVFGRVSFAVSLIVLMGIETWRRWLLYFVIVSQFVVNFILIGASIGACAPVRKYWDRSTPGTCLGPNIQRNLGYAQGGMISISPFHRAPVDTNISLQHLCRSGPCLHACLCDIKDESTNESQDRPPLSHESWCIVGLSL
jgi:hypothetical protein